MIILPSRTHSWLLIPLLAAVFASSATHAQTGVQAGGAGPMQESQDATGLQRGQHRGRHQMHGKHHGGGQATGHGGRHGMTHKHHLFGENWKTTLSTEQKTALDRLHVDYAKSKAKIKSAIKGLKVQLAVLVTSEAAQAGTTATKIDELLEAKREMLTTKYAYIAAQRALLTPEQQISFDMDVIHRAMHGGREKGRHGGGH